MSALFLKRWKQMIRRIVPAGSAVFAMMLLGCCCISRRMGSLPSTEEKKLFSARPYFNGEKFLNDEPTYFRAKKAMKKFSFFRFVFCQENAPEKPFPAILLSKQSFAARPGEFSVRWLGHSSLCFELAGKRFMTDPVFGHASPIQGIVRRYSPPVLPLSQLPELDFVIISHDHYDHLEYQFIRSMREWKGTFVTALGVGARLRSWGISPKRIIELGRGESTVLGNIRITAENARHFSGRSWSDRDRTLWASYIIETIPVKDAPSTEKQVKIFFGADSGYGKHFAAIGKKYGPFDLVCLEIDAWNERWPHNHMFPQEMPLAYRDLRGRLFLPIHWGVFDLAMHKWNLSISEICLLAEKHNIPIITPKMGELVDLTNRENLPHAHWWKDK